MWLEGIDQSWAFVPAQNVRDYHLEEGEKALAGAKRDQNIVYNLFRTVTSPITRFTRLITPRVILDAHIGLVAFFLLIALALAATGKPIIASTGMATLAWRGSAPSQSSAVFQICVGDAAEPSAPPAK